MVEGETVMRRGFLRSSRYSPGNMDRESLEALFVGRGEIMDDVLSRLSRSIRSQEKHFVLLIGPRGSGKTHFLALAYHRLMDRLDTADARDSVAVALLNEEEWGVASFLDLIVRILRALSDQTSDRDTEIAGIYDRFSKDSADAETFAVGLLRQYTRGKTLLLLCENLVDLFHGLGEEGQKRWRATIQEDGNWAILTSTPSLFAGLTLQNNPFYGFFTFRALEKIDFDTGLDLLVRKAVHEGKRELADFLRMPLGRARARAIHHLAAGNHRAYVVLSDFLDKESLENLVGPFMHMVDDLTPYYQDRMRQLPPAQRKIVEFLCLEGRPRTIKDIAAPCLMSHQTAAKQIGELGTAGFVSRVRFGRNTFCELSEPLMRICIEVKDNRTQHFRLFVEFLRHWFTTRELERRHAAFQHDDHPAELDRAHVEEALRCARTDRHEPCVREIGDHASAGRYLERVAELEPDNRRLRIERTRLHLDEGAFDAAAESVARVEVLPDRSLPERLLVAQVAAATKPLRVALDTLGIALEPEDFKRDEVLHVQAIAEILTVSVRNFGPRYLHRGLVKLRDLLAALLDEGVVGGVLTDFLIENVDNGFTGSLADWERALEGLASCLADLPDCRIPVEMLQVAVRYTKTGDERHLLSLPLEQRQLLKEGHAPSPDGRSDRI